MIDVEKTGSYIVTSLKKKYYTISSIANRYHVTVQAVYKWQNGIALPSLDNLLSIADDLDCKIDDLIIRR